MKVGEIIMDEASYQWQKVEENKGREAGEDLCKKCILLRPWALFSLQ